MELWAAKLRITRPREQEEHSNLWKLTKQRFGFTCNVSDAFLLTILVAVEVKLDLPSLAQVALPWPGGAQ
jgi:hypothetical protein